MFRLFNDSFNSPHKHSVNYQTINESEIEKVKKWL